MSRMLEPLIIGDLEISIPIIQGGMGVMVSTAPLAAAVAECGGAGTIASVGLGYGTEENETNFLKASREGLEREIRRARELTRGVVGINILTVASNYADLARTGIREKADFIISGAGLPLRLPEYAGESATKLIPVVSSARAVNIIIRTWRKRYDRLPDAIVVEGPLAGGHLGFRPEHLHPCGDNGNVLEQLVADVLKVVAEYKGTSGRQIPVIAAGGIFNGKDVARFLGLGAAGVQIATRFVATHECTVPDTFKNLYLAAGKDDLVIIPSPVGMPGRAIKTKLIDRIMRGERVPFKCNYRCLRVCDPKTAAYCIARAMFNAVSGDIDNAVVFAGSNVTRVNKIVSVKELLDEIVGETSAELART
ncbi:MAG: nitronate monooxygenase family protein [Planctomycetota bacterium]